MPSLQKFEKAPTVSSIFQSSSIEADLDLLTADERVTFERAASAFRFIAPDHKTASGARWITLIESTYDTVDNPQNAEMVRVLSKAMLVDRFPEETETDYFGGQNVTDLPHSAQVIFHKPPVGVQEFSEDEKADASALHTAIQFIFSKGYSSLVATGVADISKLKAAGPGVDNFAEAFPQTLKEFVRDMLSRGWDPSSEKCKVFLSRPAPILVPPNGRIRLFGALQPYESYLTEQLIVWRIPQFHLQEVAAQVLEEKEATQSDRPRG